MHATRLIAYRLPAPEEWQLRAAPLQRDWMDAFKDRWPYRCLPLNIANQAGWEILCPVGFEVVWDGGSGLEALSIRFDERAEVHAPLIKSHFGGGVLTLCPPLLFRTEEPIGLFVRGPCNHWIDGAAALDAWVESWGLEASFTVNWRITRAGALVRFERGDPICLLQPFDMGLLEQVAPELSDLAADPVLAARHEQWRSRRSLFSALRDPRKSQHTYTRGSDEAGGAVSGHRTTLELRDFVPARATEGRG